MHDQREVRGHWWRPGHRSDSVGGIFSYQPSNGLELDLFDSLDQHETNSFKGNEDTLETVERIYGITHDGDPVTLVKCYRTFERVVYGTEITNPETFVIETGLIGEHFDGDIRFNTVRLRLEALHRWFSRSGLDFDFEPEKEEKSSEDKPESDPVVPVVRAEYAYPDSETIDVGDMTLHFDPGITVERERSSVNLGEYTSIDIDSGHENGTVSLPEAQAMSRKVRLFIALALQEPVQSLEMTGYYQSDTGSDSSSVEILMSANAESTTSDDQHPQEILFLLPDIEDEFERILQTWLQTFDELAPMFNFYFKSIYNDTNISTTYLLRRTMLEAYYNIRISEKQFSGLNKQKLDMISSQTEAETIGALMGEETDSSFEEQLNMILQNHSKVVDQLSEQLVDRITSFPTTNELPSDCNQNISSVLQNQSQNLGMICTIVILSETGFSPRKISTFVELS
ncbi:hypothetical protein MUK72_19075 (plasmid) [Halococcus dombrowskii]|uniref:ApeA N-terminal domain-containing protein n=1 Tax=Halococcus dombrowskii TaxID=179637 RepID=A0AAV3SIN1_HALDO|nr:hypothetical protein [Halococcus dombrowskii]UOO97259.1 hypothetical protein MUK72_19075 [Halococcus dombrowskii]